MTSQPSKMDDPNASPFARLQSTNFPARGSGNYNQSIALAPDPAGYVDQFARDAANLAHYPPTSDELLAFIRAVQARCRDQFHKLEHKRNHQTACKWPEYRVDVVVGRGGAAPQVSVREEWISTTCDALIKEFKFSTAVPEARRAPSNPFRRRFDFVLETFSDALAMHEMMLAEIETIVERLDIQKQDTIDLLRAHLFNAKLVLLHLQDLSRATDNQPSRLDKIRQLAGAANDALATVGRQDKVSFAPVLL